MLVNPELKDLSLDDLIQRYADSFVNYGDKIELVSGFKNSSVGRMIEFFRDDAPYLEPFNWEKMDNSRPEPKVVEVNGNVIWCSYLHHRQWCRGFSFDRNCQYSMLLENGLRFDNKEVIQAWFHQNNNAKLYPQDLLDRRKFKILSRSLSWAGAFMFFRESVIGRVDSEGVLLDDDKFLVEVNERMVGVPVRVRTN